MQYKTKKKLIKASFVPINRKYTHIFLLLTDRKGVKAKKQMLIVLFWYTCRICSLNTQKGRL